VTAYPAEANGKLTVVVFDNSTNGSPNAALSDGINKRASNSDARRATRALWFRTAVLLPII